MSGTATCKAILGKKDAPAFSRCIYYNIYYKVPCCTVILNKFSLIHPPFASLKPFLRDSLLIIFHQFYMLEKLLKSMSDPILIEKLLGQLKCGSKAHDSKGLLLVGSKRSLSQDAINRGRYAWHWILNCFTLLWTLKLKSTSKVSNLLGPLLNYVSNLPAQNPRLSVKKCPQNSNRN